MTNRVANAARRPTLDHLAAADQLALLATTSLVDLLVIRVHQHLGYLFHRLVVFVVLSLDVVVERAAGVSHEHVMESGLVAAIAGG